MLHMYSLLDSGIARRHVASARHEDAAASIPPPSLDAPRLRRARSRSGPPGASASLGSSAALPRPSPPPRRRPPSRPGLAAQVPVIAPVAIGSDGMSYNVNADTMSGAIAAALSARALLLLTDVAGVLDAAPEDGGKLLPTLSLDDVSRLLQPEPGPEPCPQPEPPTPAQPLTPTPTQTRTRTLTRTPTLTSPEP